MSRIWRAFGLKPHRTETFTLSTDPLFIEKVQGIVGLYPNQPDRALAPRVDEKSQTQALDRRQPRLPMRPGQVERRSGGYVRHGPAPLFAALEVKNGAVLAESRRRRPVEFHTLVDQNDATVPPDLDLHLILDNYGRHKTTLIRRWLTKRPRYRVRFTPAGASWLNLVERFRKRTFNSGH